MQTLVTGTGRSGSNLLSATLRALNVPFMSAQEDRSFFSKKLPAHYGAKLSTDDVNFNTANIKNMMDQHPNLNIVFSIRHPVDMAMSKIVRGQAKGSTPHTDSQDRQTAKQSSLEGSIDVIKYANRMKQFVETNFPNRVLAIKMEDLILDTDNTTCGIAFFLGVDVPDISPENIVENDANRYHQERYGNKIHTDQVDIYERYDTVYDEFFKDKDYLPTLKTELKDVLDDWGYVCE